MAVGVSEVITAFMTSVITVMMNDRKIYYFFLAWLYAGNKDLSRKLDQTIKNLIFFSYLHNQKKTNRNMTKVLIQLIA